MSPLPDSSPTINVNLGNGIGFLTNGCRLDFRIVFAAAGTNYLWIRGGDPLADGNGDSVHAGIDGHNVAEATQITGAPTFTTLGWNWVGSNSANARVTLVVTNAGTHIVNLWMREDGFLLDKILLTTDVAFTPTGTGPAESQQVGSGTPTISIARNAGALVITYTGTLVSAATVNGTYLPVAGASGGSYTVPTGGTGNQFYRAKQ